MHEHLVLTLVSKLGLEVNELEDELSDKEGLSILCQSIDNDTKKRKFFNILIKQDIHINI